MTILTLLTHWSFTHLCALAPGWWFVRRVALDPAERILASALISQLLTATIVIIGYGMSMPRPYIAALLIGITVLTTIRWAMDVFSGRLDAGSWLPLLAWLALSLWITAWQCRIVAHGLPNTEFDWIEHWLRSQFFSKSLPIETRFGIYSLGARGPLFNAISGGMLVVLKSDEYYAYQTVACVLNTFAVIPFGMLLNRLGRIPAVHAWLISTMLCATLPFFTWNESVTWTKNYTAAWVLSGIYFMHIGLQANQPSRCASGLAAMIIGFLSHYLSIGYIVPFAVVLLIESRCRSWRWRHWCWPNAFAGGIVGAWFAFLGFRLGWSDAFFSNTLLSDVFVKNPAATTPPPYPWVFLVNLLVHFLPSRLLIACGMHADELLAEARMMHCAPNQPMEIIHASWPSVFFVNGIVGITLYVGLAVFCVVLALYFSSLKRAHENSEGLFRHRFWAWFATLGFLLQVSFPRWLQPSGCFSLNLHPFVYLGVVWMAASMREWPGIIRRILFVLVVIEGAYNSWIIQSMQERRLPMKHLSERQFVPLAEFVEHESFVRNYHLKMNFGAVCISDKLGRSLPSVFVLLVAGACFMGVVLIMASTKFGSVRRAAPSALAGPRHFADDQAE